MRAACWKSGIVGLLLIVSVGPLHGEPQKSGALEIEAEELQPGLALTIARWLSARQLFIASTASPLFILAIPARIRVFLPDDSRLTGRECGHHRRQGGNEAGSAWLVARRRLAPCR